jgi:hypothetical protein
MIFVNKRDASRNQIQHNRQIDAFAAPACVSKIIKIGSGPAVDTKGQGLYAPAQGIDFQEILESQTEGIDTAISRGVIEPTVDHDG